MGTYRENRNKNMPGKDTNLDRWFLWGQGDCDGTESFIITAVKKGKI